MPGSVLGHAPSESCKREFLTAADHIGGKPRQNQYGTNPRHRAYAGVGWACPGRFRRPNCGIFPRSLGYTANGVLSSFNWE